MSKTNRVIVVGGGWAGLTTAVELVRHDVPVTLLESAKQLGGRARRVPFENTVVNQDIGAHDIDTFSTDKISATKISVDNGQHLLIGAYDSTLSALRTVGVSEDTVLKREKLMLNMRRIDNRNVKIVTGRLPAPLHLAWGLLLASGLSMADRILALQFCRVMQKSNFKIPTDISCLELFNQYRQPNNVVKVLWEPLCLATLNTPIDTASAAIYLRVLREAFSNTRSESDLLFTRVDLGSIYPDHAMDYIEKHGGNVRLGQRVINLTIENKQLKGIKLQDGEIEAQQIVLATPHFATRKLLASHSMFADLTEQLEQLGTQPIVTVYLQYPQDIKLSGVMTGLVDTTAQWIFDRRIYGQPGLMAVIISSSGPHMELDNDKLGDKIQNEIAAFFPNWPKPLTRMVIREKRATFSCVTDSNNYRPGVKTDLPGLWLAGDYTNTGLPATLESAVRSGKRCAKAILKNNRLSGDNN